MARELLCGPRWEDSHGGRQSPSQLGRRWTRGVYGSKQHVPLIDGLTTLFVVCRRVNIYPRPALRHTLQSVVYFLDSMDFNVLEQKDILPFKEHLEKKRDYAAIKIKYIPPMAIVRSPDTVPVLVFRSKSQKKMLQTAIEEACTLAGISHSGAVERPEDAVVLKKGTP